MKNGIIQKNEKMKKNSKIINKIITSKKMRKNILNLKKDKKSHIIYSLEISETGRQLLGSLLLSFSN